MDSEKIYNILMTMINCNDLPFFFRVKILSNLLSHTALIESLGFKYIELIDYMMKFSNSNEEKTEIMELKITALDYLYYSDEFLNKKNIDIRNLVLEYLHIVKDNCAFMRTTNVLNSYFIDGSYKKDINDNLLNYLCDNDKVKLLFELSESQLVNIIDHEKDNHIFKSIICFKKIRERFEILKKFMLVICYQKSNEIFYMLFPHGYSYESVISDWYWTKNTTYDFYLENNIISEEESKVLHKVGNIISNDNVLKYEEMNILYCEFVHGRTLQEVLFPDFVYCNS